MKEKFEEGTPLNNASKRLNEVIKSNAESIKILDHLISKKETQNIPPKELGLYHLNKACSILNKLLNKGI